MSEMSRDSSRLSEAGLPVYSGMPLGASWLIPATQAPALCSWTIVDSWKVFFDGDLRLPIGGSAVIEQDDHELTATLLEDTSDDSILPVG